MPSFHKPQPGQRSTSLVKSASFMSNVVDAVNEIRSGNHRPRPQQGRSLDPIVVSIKNSTGADLLRGHVVQLKQSELTDYPEAGDGVDAAALRDARAPWFDSQKVAEPRWLRLAVVLKPIKQGEYGPVAIDGFCTVRANINSAKHLFITTKAGQLRGESSNAGMFQLLAPLADELSGEREVYVKFVPFKFYGKLTDTSPKKQSGVWYPGTVKPWFPLDPTITTSSGSTGTDDQPKASSDADYSCWVWCIDNNKQLVGNDEVIVEEISGRLIAIQSMKCPVASS